MDGHENGHGGGHKHGHKHIWKKVVEIGYQTALMGLSNIEIA
jgi:hypothetical protein